MRTSLLSYILLSLPDSTWKIAVDLAVIITALFTIMLFWPVLTRWRDRRKLNRDFGGDFYSREDVNSATSCYVRPYCSESDPSQTIDLPSSGPWYEVWKAQLRLSHLFSTVDHFCADYSPKRHMILLADSGMGKTSFLLNYYVANNRRFRQRHRIVIIPLGRPEALLELKRLDKKKETVLFLDAFDEDREAVRDYEARLKELMTAASSFRRVLITARTQFFPREDAIPTETGIKKVGPHKHGAFHKFAKIYLAPFTDSQVDEFLRRRYRFFWQRSMRKKARLVVKRIPQLSIRPLLLAYIPDVLEKAARIKFSYQLYELMVDYWYQEEADWWGGIDHIKRFSEEIAVKLYKSFLDAGADRMKREEVNTVSQSLGLQVEEWKTTSRSLLNRDAQGNYKFAHRSVMEYLFVKRFLEGDARCGGVEWTDQMKSLFLQMLRYHRERDSTPKILVYGADLQGTDLSPLGGNLKGLILPGSNLKNVTYYNYIGLNLDEADLHESNLEGIKFYKATLREAILFKAVLQRCDLRYAQAAKANFQGANLENAKLNYADLTSAILEGANLQGADLQVANFRGAHLQGADLRGAKIGGTSFLEANLAGSFLQGVSTEPDVPHFSLNFAAANLEGADLRCVSFGKANLAGAVTILTKLQGADLSKASISWEQIAAAEIDEKTILPTALDERRRAYPSNRILKI